MKFTRFKSRPYYGRLKKILLTLIKIFLLFLLKPIWKQTVTFSMPSQSNQKSIRSLHVYKLRKFQAKRIFGHSCCKKEEEKEGREFLNFFLKIFLIYIVYVVIYYFYIISFQNWSKGLVMRLIEVEWKSRYSFLFKHQRKFINLIAS